MLVKKKTKWTHAVRTTAPNFRNYQIVKKNEPPGRKITLKINERALLKATACNKMNIPLPRGPGPKNKTQKKGNESGINYPGELQKRRILHGDTKYLLGTVV
jgi:hypothetical protein